ncbi:MAG TPA: carboxypeptidase-like regulatory domain-containing protein [Gemmatirosa sp.]
MGPLLAASESRTDTVGAVVRGIVVDSVADDAPLAGATAELVLARDPTQSRTAHTDSAGKFQLDAVAPGRYVIGFFHPALDVYGVEAPTVEVDAEAGAGVSAVRAHDDVYSVKEYDPDR